MPMNSNNCGGWRFYLVFILVGVAFYVQDRSAIFCLDDWAYAFQVDSDARNYLSVADDGARRLPVASLADAFHSQTIDYAKSNGRFLVHTLVQFICGTMPMHVFVVLNSLVFLLFTFLVYRLTMPRGQSSVSPLSHLLLVSSAIWLLFPHKGMTFMGNVSIGVNYLWVSAAVLLFMLLWQRWQEHEVGRAETVFGVVAALVVGSLQESFSIGMSAALLMQWATTNRLGWLRLFFFLGMLTCVLSPANFSRADAIGGLGFHVRSLLGLASSPVFLMFIVLVPVLAFKKQWGQFCRRHSLLLWALVASVLFTVFVAYNGRHQLTFVNVLSLLLVLHGWYELTARRHCRLRRTVVAVLLSVALLSYVPILHARRAYHDCYEQLLQRVAESDGTTVVDGSDFEAMGQHIRQNPLLDCNYVLTFSFNRWDFYERSLSVYLSRGRTNRLVTVILPEDNPEYIETE